MAPGAAPPSLVRDAPAGDPGRRTPFEQAVVAALGVGLAALTCWTVVAVGRGGGVATVVAGTWAAAAGAAAGAGRRRPALAGVTGLAAAAVAGAAVAGAVRAAGDPPPGEALRAAVLGLLSTTQWQYDVGLITGLAAVGACVGWWAARSAEPWPAVAVCGCLVVGSPFKSPAPDAATLPGTLAIAAGVALVVAARAARSPAVPLLTGSPRPGGSRGVRATRLAAVTALTLAAATLPPLSHARPLERVVAGGAAASVGVSLETVPGGPLTALHTPVLSYRSSTSQPVYLRLATETEFSHGDWYEPDVATQSLVADGAVPASAATPRAGEMVSVDVRIDGSAEHPALDTSVVGAPFPGEPAAIEPPAIAYAAEYAGDRDGGPVSMIENVTTAVPVRTLRTTAVQADAVPPATAAAYPAWAAPFTALPVGGPGDARELATVRDIARAWTAGATSPQDAAAAIEATLRSSGTFAYTLTPPPSPAGRWPIVDFLTRTHLGYCQYFASAMGALTRSLGIPTRLITGFAPGAPDGAGGFDVTSDDAHVWVQLYFPGDGWVDYDPTPHRTAPAAPAAPAAAGATASAGTSWRGAVPLLLGVLVRAALGLLAAVLVALGWALLWVPRECLGAWRRVCAVAHVTGMPRRPAETDAEYARRVGARCPPQLAETLRHLAAGAAAARFSGRGPVPRAPAGLTRRAVLGVARSHLSRHRPTLQ